MALVLKATDPPEAGHPRIQAQKPHNALANSKPKWEPIL